MDARQDLRRSWRVAGAVRTISDMQFILTVDVEADSHTRGSDPISLSNLAALPRFQALCDAYKVPPTYLVSHEVLADASTVQLIKAAQDAGRAEVGTHLHPWTTPPKSAGDEKLRFPCELSDTELRDKFSTLHAALADVFGAPTSYRAGRWGFDERQEKILEEYGYVADTSVSPRVDWRRFGGPDYRSEGARARLLAGKLYEVPATVLCTGFFRKEGSMLVRAFFTLPENILTRSINALFFKRKWLRIFPETTEKELDAVLDSAEFNRLPCVVFMIHSHELFLGASTYAKTEAGVEHMFSRLEFLLRRLQERGISGTTLSSFATALSRA